MDWTAAARLAEQEAEHAEFVIGWIDHHSDDIGSEQVTRACVSAARGVRTRQQHIADLYREVGGILAGVEPLVIDLTPTRKRRIEPA
jgi:predicted TIM-barrel fold metal-dependent hydrolase